MALPIGAAWPPNAPYGPIALNTGDKLRGDASGASVDYIVSGVGYS